MHSQAHSAQVFEQTPILDPGAPAGPADHVAPPSPTTLPYRPMRPATVADATRQRILEARVRELGQGFAGEVGIAVRGRRQRLDGQLERPAPFPQQSVSKFWVAINGAAAGRCRPAPLDQRVTLTRQDLTLFPSDCGADRH